MTVSELFSSVKKVVLHTCVMYKILGFLHTYYLNEMPGLYKFPVYKHSIVTRLFKYKYIYSVSYQ
jgi:hypothetical protein